MAALPLHWQSIQALSEQIHSGELASVDLVDHFLARIEALDPTLRAYIRVEPERARASARAADLALRSGQDLGPLHGIPFAAKDLFDVRGLPTTAGSRLLEDNRAAADATVIRRLTQAGMILLGKTHTVQFAYGGVGINHDYGTPHNPWQRTPHVPGGSSSGSGVAVAAGLAPMALGSDTGGSVRIPAALCGTVGLKTTVGQVSRAGVFPLSWSLDTVGLLTRRVVDAAWVYAAMQGADPADPTTVDTRPQDVLSGLGDGVDGLRLAFAESVFFDDVDPDIERAVRACGEVFAGLGASIRSMAFPEAAEAQALNPRGLVIAAEAYTVHADRLKAHAAQVDPIIAPRILSGRDIPASDYIKTTRAWAELRQRVQRTLRDVDALLVPTTMIPALPVDRVDASMEAYTTHNLQYLRNTAIGNILNLCAVSVPCGFTANGLPIGLMIYGKPCQEDTVLRLAHAYEQATEWHRRTPDLGWAGSPR